MKVICIRPIAEAINCQTKEHVDLAGFKLPVVGSYYIVIQVIEKEYGTYFVLAEFDSSQHFNSNSFAIISDLDEREIHAERFVKGPIRDVINEWAQLVINFKRWNCRCVIRPI